MPDSLDEAAAEYLNALLPKINAKLAEGMRDGGFPIAPILRTEPHYRRAQELAEEQDLLLRFWGSDDGDFKSVLADCISWVVTENSRLHIKPFGKSGA